MQLGAIHMWGEDEQKFRREVRLSAELGFDLVGIGDSPAGWHDLGVSMAIAAAEAPGKVIAPMVTSPFLRHPLIIAGMMSTVYDLNHGKAALGFATGGSSAMAIGHAPATQAVIREHIAALRALCAGEPTQWAGAPVTPLRFAREIPIMYSAFGPKGLQLAGELCDGAILFTGSNRMDDLKHKIGAVRTAAQNAGRDPKSVKIWVASFCSVRESREWALDDLKALIVVTGMGIMSNPALAAQIVPPHLKEKMTVLIQRYDASEHAVVAGRNVSLLTELGLTEFLGSFDTVAGSPAEVKITYEAMRALGVDAFLSILPGHADPETNLRALAEIAEQAK
jgi:alkanesulfonate monooxygenase SsuD/methylene tetrahydromethanopterin reductase-like flavin-dependent oxidoreductase (luciferase family)